MIVYAIVSIVFADLMMDWRGLRRRMTANPGLKWALMVLLIQLLLTASVECIVASQLVAPSAHVCARAKIGSATIFDIH